MQTKDPNERREVNNFDKEKLHNLQKEIRNKEAIILVNNIIYTIPLNFCCQQKDQLVGELVEKMRKLQEDLIEANTTSDVILFILVFFDFFSSQKKEIIMILPLFMNSS